MPSTVIKTGRLSIRLGHDGLSKAILAQQDVPAELIVVDDGSTDGTPSCLPASPDESPSTTWEGVVSRRHGIEAPRSRRASCSCFSTRTTSFLRTIWRDSSRLQPLFLSADSLPLRVAWNRLRRRARSLRAGPPFDLDWDPFHALAAAGSPPIAALAVRRPAATRVGPFDETESVQADWDYWLRLAASGARFQGVPGNVVIIRRRNDSMSASAGAQLAVAGLAVLERHLSRHQRCPACITRTQVSGVGERLCSARRPGTSRAGFTSRAARGG